MNSTFARLLSMAVLPSGLALAADPTNLVRNPSFENAGEAWTLPNTYRVVDDTAHGGSHSLRLSNTNPATYLLARQSLRCQPGRKYLYSAWIKTRGVKGDDSGATICLEWSGAQGWIGGSYAQGKKGDQDWFLVEGGTGAIPTNATSVAVELYLRQGMTGTAWFDDVVVVEQYPPPLECVMLEPNYRGRLAAGASGQRVRVRAHVGDRLKDGLNPEQTSLKIAIASGDREIVESTAAGGRAGDNDLTLEAGVLPPGDYRVRIELLGSDRSRLAFQELDLHKLPSNAVPPTVFIDEHNRTIVNGKPFFPLGWYFGPGPTDPTFRDHLDRLAASPFNTIMCYGVNAGSTNTVREYLDCLARRDLKIIYSIKDVYEGTRWYHEPVLSWRGEETIVRRVVESFRDHPAVLAWYLNDELPLTMRARLEARHRLVSQLDPNHPTWAVLYQVDDLYGYLNTADVLGTDPYPIPNRPVTLAADWTRKSRAVSGGFRPLWMVPQAFDWASYRKDPAKGRPPTLDEERVMTYLCLIHGAHGLIYYSYADLLRDPKVGFDQRWADMVKVGQEVKQLEPALLSAVPPPKMEIKAPASVHSAVRADDTGRTYVLLANPNPMSAANVRVMVPRGATLRLLCNGEDRPLERPDAAVECPLTVPPMGAMTLIVFPGFTAAETVYHVAPTGSDLNPGTRRKPFATLERARQAVRMAGLSEVRRVTVHGGSYELRSTFVLDRLDSGTATHPVIWQAAPAESVRLVGGMSVPASVWQAVAEAPVLARLDPVARGRVVEADLRVLGVTNLPPFPVAYHGVPPGPELFFNQNRMTIARWPNEGWAAIARILESGSRPRDGDKRGLAGSFEYAGDRPARWPAAEGVWLQGYWCYDWYDEVIKIAAIDPATHRITLAAPHLYSLMQGNPSPRRYRALNVLEELDEPGEFVIDRGTGRLYLWPPADLKGAQITLATLEAPVLALEDASHITVQGFVVDSGLDNGIEVRNGTECEVAGCEVRNLRRLGIQVTGGTKHRVTSCDIHHTGQGGLVLGGGDRKTLTPAGHEAVNNHIWRFSEHQLTSAYGLSFAGVGNRAAHNLIHDAPHQAVFVGGNDHRFEFNEVHHVCTETDDCGALYKGRNPSCRGNLIRFNYWHDIGSPMGHGNAAVYFDDGDGGDTVFGNVFVRCGEPGRGSFGTVFSHGGHDNHAENNVFVDCKRALGSAPWDEARWRDALKGGQDCFFTEKLLQEVDITKPPYTDRYPELVGYLDPPAGVPRVNHARLNLLVRCGEVSGGNWRLEPDANWSTNDDPGFVDGSKGDYRLRRDAPVFKHLPGFRPVPFEKMGLQR